MLLKWKRAVWSLLGLLCLCFFCLGSVTRVSADSLYIIRIGLTQHLKQQSSVTIQTKKIALGYCVNNRFSEYIHMNSKNGFVVKPATGYYLVSDKVYADYASVKADYDKAVKISSVKKYTYICMLGKNKWGLYVGGINNISKVSGFQNQLEQKLSVSFGSVTSYNGHRVMISGGGSAYLFDGADTGQYVQIAPNVLNKSGSKTLTVNGYEYRGRMEIGPYGSSKLTVVNISNVENYLRSVVGSEMERTAPMEALKAQAVASRTYAQNHCNNTGDTNTSNPYSINDTDTYQAYGGYAKENGNAVEAVTQTRGECIYASGNQINANFFASSGGATESSLNVWGTSASYLVSVSDVDELLYAPAAWTVTYTAKEIGNLLGVGDVTQVSVVSATASGRVSELLVKGSKNTISLTGDNVRTRLGLKSSKFKLVTKESTATGVTVAGLDTKQELDSLKGCYAVSKNGKVSVLGGGLTQIVVTGAGNLTNYMQSAVTSDAYLFAGLGDGDGVGMSQAGAKAMASRGDSYKQILSYYYGKKTSVK
jgi:stage II sporulation protein D